MAGRGEGRGWHEKPARVSLPGVHGRRGWSAGPGAGGRSAGGRRRRIVFPNNPARLVVATEPPRAPGMMRGRTERPARHGGLRFSSAFRNLAGRWDTAGVPSHRGGTGCPVICLFSSRRRCGGPLRAAEAACRLLSLRGGTRPPRLSAPLRTFSAMILRSFAHRTVSTACVTSCLQQRSAGARASTRPTINALPLSRAAKPRIVKDGFSMSRQRTGTGVIRAGLARPSVETGYLTA